MFLHPVHSSSSGGRSWAEHSSQSVDRYIEKFLDERIASFAEDRRDTAGDSDGDGLKPLYVNVFYSEGTRTLRVPCFFVVDGQSNDASERGGTGSSYWFYHPFVVVRLSATFATKLESLYGTRLFPDHLSLGEDIFKTPSGSNPLAYVFQRYIDLYNLDSQSFRGQAVLENVQHKSVPPSSIADARARLQLLLEMAQPFLRHFMGFLRTKDTLLIPGRIREVVVVDQGAAAAAAAIYNDVPLRELVTNKFLPLDQSLYPLCYGITRILAHGGSPSVTLRSVADPPHQSLKRKRAVSERLGLYQRVYRVFLAYMLKRLDALRLDGTVKDDSASPSDVLKTLDKVYGAPSTSVEGFPIDVPLDAVRVDLKPIGELVHYAASSREIPACLRESIAYLGHDCNVERVREALDQCTEEARGGYDHQRVEETLQRLLVS